MTITLDWWLNGFSSVNETQVPTSARTSSGSRPISAATVMATGVTIDAVAALVTRFVITVVITARTMTSASGPAERSEIASAMTSASPLATTIAPSPIEPARMPSTFGSSARAAEPGEITPVSTISSAPPVAATSAGTRPNDAATITTPARPGRYRSSPAAAPGWPRPATAPRSSSRATASAVSAATNTSRRDQLGLVRAGSPCARR